MLNIDKLTYSIGQVSELTETAQSTLRYWETVIVSLDPLKTEGGSRRYSKDDVEIILTIKDLLYNQGFTIKGANLFLSKQVDENQKQGTLKTELMDSIQEIKKNTIQGDRSDLKYILDELTKIKSILER